MPSEPELFSPEAQSFFTDAIISARLRVSFAESMVASAQRELDDARDSLLRLEKRRKQLGVPDITNTDDMELPDDVSLLSDDHAHSVGSRSTMFIGSVGGITDDKSHGFSLKNSIRNLRGRGTKNSIDCRSVSSAPAVVKRSGGEEYVALNTPSPSTDEVDHAPTIRSVTPERGGGEPTEDNDNNNNKRKGAASNKSFAVSPTRTVSTAPTESTQEDNEDARSRVSAKSATLEKEDEQETIEYAIFKQLLKDHYTTSPKREPKGEKDDITEDRSIASFEPIQVDMVTMDTIIEEPADPEDGVAQIEVTKCGIPQINGSYLKFDARDGVPTYSKIDKFESYETMFSIGRWSAANGNKKWYITAIVPGQSPPRKSVFYVAYSASNVPPKEGWMVVDEGFDLFLKPEYTEKGVPAAPKLEWEVDDGVASVANTHRSIKSTLSNSHYYEVGQQVLNNVSTRDKDAMNERRRASE
mmetsp:Transcript_9955/g.15106  ORF Transcript_9955/g.15106 Transcript_9955/m.15106 type:complete len:470 (-) Transcript_9955:141-1550(-)|eukprot:CAMPEP_0201718606 /NCGR_PEP_ID=MMETSP0593-20130828/4078_1 /ASSEMBLY_ACC=CAM_ASM_000672 /TAXON_ID=267983 /ORGANISM="Skeletonema japonicum, Strain CCMP2506" /LENGTH=469 /DNA_ID=CAMNT_0048208945 /DNA_START=108 /DNA_END=1517 /DNA_ORIENTATION=+